MAAGYAEARPAVHPHVISRVMSHLQIKVPVNRALDVGCGAGLSTRELVAVAQRSFGIDPVGAMVQQAGIVAPNAFCAVGVAEFLPFASDSMNLITAAGSLNYADLTRFFPEALLVLEPGGVLVVYDFSQGRSFRNGPSLSVWFDQFKTRYPSPTNSGRSLDPATLEAEAIAFHSLGSEQFQVGLMMDQRRYVDYIMTETNVANAIRSGATSESINKWCRTSLDAVFSGEQKEVLFNGYIAYLQKP